MRGIRLARPASRALCAVLVSGQIALPALANPSGGRVVAGSATIQNVSASRLEVRQSSARAILDWDSFSIAAGERTHFAQPSKNAIALNRVRGGEVSQLFGTLSADGRVVLVNGAGIHFGPSARVDVGGLIATTADVSNASFLASDRLAFTTPGNGAIVNEGMITVRDAGLAALVAPWVANTGTIAARLGKIALASGDTFTLDLAGDALLEIAVDASAVDGAARGLASSGALLADGGAIALISADGARAALDGAINLSGVARARSLESRDGRIVLSAGDDASVRVAGTLDASGIEAGARGGSITVTGGEIALEAGARLDASGDAGGGEIRVGGDVQGGGTLLRARGLTVAAGAELRADALGAGAGGTIIAWSDGHTEFAGALSALGRGDVGGFAEISGHQTLALTGDVALGQGGRLLLDPTEILISDGAGATLTTDTLRRQLITGTTVDLVATDDIVLDATLDGRVSSGGVAGGGVSFRSTAGNVLLNADLITNRGAVTLDAALDVVMAATGGGLSGGSGVAVVVSNAANGLGSQGITVRAGGGADLQFLATSGALDVQATGDVDLARDLGTLASPIASLMLRGASIDLPASVVTANGAITIDASAALAMAASDQLFVSNGSGTTTKGSGPIQLSYGAGDLELGDVETAGAIAIAYTGVGSSRVRLNQQLGGSNAPIGGLTIDAPVVDVSQSIVAQGAVTLGNASSNDCTTLTGCTILRRDIFTRGGDFTVLGDAQIDPRRALEDAAGNPLLVTPVLGVDDTGALILGAQRAALTVNELAGRTFVIHDLREVVETAPGSGIFNPLLDLNNNPVTAPFAEQLVTPIQNGALAALFPNARQEVEANATSEDRIGERVDTTWILTIDTTGGAAAGDVTFAGVVSTPNLAQERQSTGFLPASASHRRFEKPGGNCPAPCPTYLPGDDAQPRWNRILDANGDVLSLAGDANGQSEFFELGIVAGAGGVSFGQFVDGSGVLQLNLESASALSLPVRLALDADPNGGQFSADCGTEVSCFGSIRLPRALLPTLDANAPPPGTVVSEPAYYAFVPDQDNNNQPTVALGLLRFDGTSTILEQDLGNEPLDMVALLRARPGNSTHPTTGTYTSTPDTGTGRTDSAGGFSFSGGTGGLFGGGSGLGAAGGLPAGDDSAIASNAASSGANAPAAEEDPTAAGSEGCSQASPSAYQATPGQAAFDSNARGGPFSVDVFCGSFRLVEAADPGGAFGELPFFARDFWSAAGFSNAAPRAPSAAPVAP